MNGSINLKTVLVMFILGLVGVLGLLGVSTVRTYMSGAAADTEPKGVLAKPNDDGKTAMVTWSSDKATMGVVEYGTTPASLLLSAIEAEAVTDHQVSLSPLKSNVTYYFRIRVGEEVFDNGGIPYSFKTKAGVETVSPVPLVTQVVEATPTMKIATSSGTTTSSTCDRTVDYNGDGVVNSVDYITCQNSNQNPCNKPGDVDGNGVINSLDTIKCLQKSAP